MSGLGSLLRQRFRRDRIQLLVWVLGFAALASVGHSAVSQSYGTPKDRAGVIVLLEQTPSVLVLRGTPQGTQTDAFQFMLLFAFLGVMIGLMATFLAVRHTRGDEEQGRAELVESTPAGRITPLIATALEGVIAVAAIGIVNAAGFVLYGADAGAAVLAGLALASVGLCFLGIGLLSAQIMRTSRGANGLAAALVAAAYMVRGIGDATGTVDSDDPLSMTAGWVSWLSPIGWGQRTSPFSDPTVWPALLGVALGAIAFAGALALRSSRDIDSSIIRERAGRAQAHATLAGPIALVWRQLRNPTIGWLVAAALFGLLVGSLSETLTASAPADVKENLGDTVGSIAGPNAHGDLVDLFIVAMFSVIGAIAAVCAVQSVARARQDEANGTAEIVLSTAVSRIRWFVAYLVIAVVSTVLVVGVAVLGAIAGAAGAGAPSGTVDTITSAALAQLPAVFLLLALVALVFALLPRLTIGLGWTLLLLAILIGQFGGLFGLPDWARDLSPFSHTPVVTEANADWGPAWVMLGLAVVVAAASVLLVRRRDVALGG
ncbi:polyketide antibiotic transporter [Leifsonia sp. YIM 134122]|uniref:Polyketide antibiotic transporter n=1 Tax=Leifsonia stereocauli TaxID=3134136 RepID=A0ABU9W561_9MICO